MAFEPLGWLQDVSGYLRLGLEKAVVPGTSLGEDFSDSRYQTVAAQVVERLHPSRMELVLREVIRETADTRTLRFDRTDGTIPPFRAGQYLNLHLEVAGVRTSRPYSISSPPGAGHVDLTVRNKRGGFVAPYLFSKAAPGERFESSGPRGSFHHEPLIDTDELVFLAGGSGITPFMSMLRDQAGDGWPRRVHLIYGSRLVNSVIFGRELKALSAGAEDRFRYTLVVSEPPPRYKGETGLLDVDQLRRLVGEVEGKTFFVCGPSVMLDLVLPALERLGVRAHRLRTELYGPPPDVTSQPGWPREVPASATFEVVVDGGPSFTATAGEPLLCAFERQGVTVRSACRSGECSLCRLRILEGRVFMPPHQGVRESDALHGYVHACVAYPLEDLKLRI